ncbi:MAG: hypothetical protein AB7V04_05480 [Desulfomonilaceae bacterium]
MKVEAASGTLIFAETLRMRYLPLSFWIILSLMLAAFTVALHLGGGPFSSQEQDCWRSGSAGYQQAFRICRGPGEDCGQRLEQFIHGDHRVKAHIHGPLFAENTLLYRNLAPGYAYILFVRIFIQKLGKRFC